MICHLPECSFTQSCLTFCDSMDCSPPGSSVHGISQARILEWVAISSSRGSNPGIQPGSPVAPALAGRFFTAEWPGNWDFGSSVGKESAYNAGDPVSIPRLGRSPGEWNANPLQSSCLEKPMDREAWWARVHEVARVGHDLTTKPPPPPPGNPLLFSH